MSTLFERHINETVASLERDPVAVGAALIRERAAESRLIAGQIRSKLKDSIPDVRFSLLAEELELRATRLDGVAQQWPMRVK